MKSLEDIEKILKEKGVAELTEDVSYLIENEKQRGISEKSKANREAQDMRKYKIAYERMSKHLGIENIDDVDSSLESIGEKLKSSERGTKAMSENEKLIKKLDEISKRLDSAENEKRDITEKAKKATIRSKLMNELSDKVFEPSLIIDSLVLAGKVDLSHDGENIEFVKGDERLNFKDGLASFFNEHKGILKSNQVAGSGSSGRTVNNNLTNQQKTITRAEYFAKSPQEQVKLAKEGVGVI